MGTLGEKIPTLPHRAREGWGTRFDATFRRCPFGRKSRLKIHTNVAMDATFGWAPGMTTEKQVLRFAHDDKGVKRVSRLAEDDTPVVTLLAEDARYGHPGRENPHPPA
jgi:hypothetical protein